MKLVIGQIDIEVADSMTPTQFLNLIDLILQRQNALVAFALAVAGAQTPAPASGTQAPASTTVPTVATSVPLV